MPELSPVQRRIRELETGSRHNGSSIFASAVESSATIATPTTSATAMKPSTKPNKPVENVPKQKKAISSPAFRRSAGLSKMLAPAPSPARPTRSSRASAIRRNRLAERAASPLSAAGAATSSASASTAKTRIQTNPRTRTPSPQPSSPNQNMNVIASPCSPSRKRLGTMVAERMRERKYVSPRREESDPPTPTVASDVSTPKTTKSIGEMVAERMQKQPRTPKPSNITTNSETKTTTTTTGNTLGSMVAERLQERGRITSPKQRALVSHIAEQKRRRRDPASPKSPVSPMSSAGSSQQQRSASSPRSNDEPSLGLVATENVRERRRQRSNLRQQQAEEEAAAEALVFSRSPRLSPEARTKEEFVSPSKRRQRPALGAMVAARMKEHPTSPSLSPKTRQVAARLREQKRQRSPQKQSFLVQQALSRRNPLSSTDPPPNNEMSSMARMRRQNGDTDGFPPERTTFPKDPFEPFEPSDGFPSPHSQFISHPTEDTPRALSNHHLHLPNLSSYDQSPTRSTTTREIHDTNSAELQYVTDDEVTLTNVRQLVETAREATLKHPLPGQPRDSSEYYMETKLHPQSHPRLERTCSSSDEGESRLAPNLSKDSQMTPDISSFYDRNPRLLRDDDDTYDYGARDNATTDEGSQGSLSYTERMWRKDRDARRAAAAAAQAEMEGPFMKHDDVEHYRKAVDTPLGRTAIGVAVAATAGCFVLGPVGLLLGAAAVGIGHGYMQIPEEERSNMNSKASLAFNKFQESALHASDKLSSTCASTYRESGVADHVPPEVQVFCTSCAADIEESTIVGKDTTMEGASIVAKVDESEDEEGADTDDVRRIITPPNNHRMRQRDKVQCLRKGALYCLVYGIYLTYSLGKVIRLAQIYRLNPSAQPRAWLDVLASAETSNSDKIEATEEVIILSKDKLMSRFFVSEGILDCLMWTIGRYLEKKQRGPDSDLWAHPGITPSEVTSAKLAATCCLTLGKSYCAAMHTEGDLQLMSMYERGTVPEERQLAQLLVEVPYHRRATKTEDPTVIENEVFAMKQLTLPQAEELAAAIASIAME